MPEFLTSVGSIININSISPIILHFISSLIDTMKSKKLKTVLLITTIQSRDRMLTITTLPTVKIILNTIKHAHFSDANG